MQKKWGVVGCGWLGFPLAQQLVNDGCTVIGTTSSKEKVERLKEKGIQPQLLKQEDFAHNHTWLGELDILVLNIPPSSFDDQYPDAMYHIAEQLNPTCKVIFISSTSVYPNINGEVDENTPTSGQQRNGPTVSKAEKKLENLLDDRLTILRMAGLVGGNRHPINYMKGRSIRGAQAPINLVHRIDCIGIILKVESTRSWGKKINVCTTQHPSKEAYYAWVAKQKEIEKPIFTKNTGSYKTVNNEASKRILEYSYQFDNPFDFPL